MLIDDSADIIDYVSDLFLILFRGIRLRILAEPVVGAVLALVNVLNQHFMMISLFEIEDFDNLCGEAHLWEGLHVS